MIEKGKPENQWRILVGRGKCSKRCASMEQLKGEEKGNKIHLLPPEF